MVSRTAINEVIAIMSGANKHRLDRNGLELQKAGIIKSKGRGRSAETMTSKDVANIVIALLGSESPKEAPGAVEKYAPLVDLDGQKGERFLDVLIKIFNGEIDNVMFVRINRTVPLAEVKYFNENIDYTLLNNSAFDNEVTSRPQFFEPKKYAEEQVVTDDEETKDDPRFQIEARIDGTVLTAISAIVDPS